MKTELEILFDELKFSKTNHLGLGDIRLTIGQQEDIIKLFNGRWIETEKEPPKYYKQVLAVMKQTIFCVWRSSDGENDSYTVCETNKVLPETPTHWMKLPPLPTQAGGGF